jgi:protein associated with RNAse G/E
MIGRKIYVCSTKYDGSPHWEFDAFYVLEEGPLLVAQNFAGQQLKNPGGLWTTPNHVRNHYWLDGRWYNVMRFEDPKTAEYSWYCNVTTPAMFDGETVRYADLDLDVHCWPSGEIKILDEDEFLENSRSMAYPPEVIERSRAAVDELITLFRSGQFPFVMLDARPPVR